MRGDPPLSAVGNFLPMWGPGTYSRRISDMGPSGVLLIGGDIYRTTGSVSGAVKRTKVPNALA